MIYFARHKKTNELFKGKAIAYGSLGGLRKAMALSYWTKPEEYDIYEMDVDHNVEVVI